MVQHMNSERAFNWTTFGDYADEVLKQEFLAVRFGNAESEYSFQIYIFVFFLSS